jgi:hypothetical protein
MNTTARWLRATTFIAMVGGLMLLPARASAQPEVSGVIGGMLGGDLNNLLEGTSSLKSTFDNGPLYGFRAGWMGGFIGLEGSFVISPTGVSISANNVPADLDAKVYYGEGNVLFFLLPGPVKPFLSVGAGWHSYDFDVSLANGTRSNEDSKVEKAGWNFGGGLKINIKGLTLRGDVRDHLTKIGPDDFGAADIAQELGITGDQTLHNVEISASIGVRF